jgi:tetratricopeptide (TPR) repeat protein
LAISYEKLGSTHTALGNLEKALTFFEKDIELSKELYEAYPTNVSFKNGLAISYEKLGSTHSALGNLEEALCFFEMFNQLSKELYEAYPQNVDFKSNLAESFLLLGIYFLDINSDKTKAKSCFQQAESLWTELVRDAPLYAEFKRFLDKVNKAMTNLEE